MDFIPKSNWQWIFDEKRSKLTLQMGDYLIDIAYRSSMLVLPGDQPIPFTVEDVARYTQLFECASLKNYEAEFACKIIIHILAIELFHTPIMPKSWLFIDAETQQTATSVSPMTHVTLTAKGGNESAHYLVLENDQDFFLCMMLDQIHQLSARKSIAQFQIVKVTADKLNLMESDSNSSWQSFQIA
jgi:cell division protein ZapC